MWGVEGVVSQDLRSVDCDAPERFDWNLDIINSDRLVYLRVVDVLVCMLAQGHSLVVYMLVTNVPATQHFTSLLLLHLRVVDTRLGTYSPHLYPPRTPYLGSID